jgi:hypothetical protein
MTAYLAHQGAAVPVGASRIWLGVHKRTGLIEDVASQIGEAIKFAPAIRDILEEYRDVVVGIVIGLAACLRSEQHHSLDAIAIQRVQRRAKLLQDGIVSDRNGHGEFSAYTP